MIAKDWQKVEALLDEVLELSPAERPGFLNKTCDGENGIRAEVESLLACEPNAEEFLRNPALSFSEGLINFESSDELVGQKIGRYRIVRELGRGGMGAVYLAERTDEDVRQLVALKMLKRELNTADIRRRFSHERQILAGLEHPQVTRLLDVGSTSDGVPFFVMEYVDGTPIDEYCQAHELRFEETLKLFRTVCAGVAFAHRQLVVHRDLKPSNILVTHDGTAKLLDFGIAKLLTPEFEESSQHTVTQLGAMSLSYASPEQLRDSTVSTATDVYSLGVVLYELLTGQRPFETTGRNTAEIIKAVCETEPEKPSTAGRRQTAAGRKGTRNDNEQRTTDNGQKVNLQSAIRNPKFLHGDLDNIVLKALRKEPERRYSTVEEFSEDVRRHLEGLPVIATKDTFGYRATKFVKRHKVGVTSASLIALTLVVGVAATAWQARAARRERDKAQYINTFLQDMLSAAAPDTKGVDVKVIDVLNEASKRARTELANKPEVMADVLMTLGKTYISLGQYEKAEGDLRAALDASLKANGELHATTATCMGWLGLALAEQNKLPDGEQISRRAVELQGKLHPDGNEDLAVALYALGYNLIRKGQPKAAQPFLQEASRLIRKHLGETNGYYMASLVMLGSAHESAGEVDAAEHLYRQAIDVGGGVEPRYRIHLAQAQFFLGSLLLNKAAYPEAEILLKQSETTYHDVMGGDTNYSVGTVKAYLGLLYFRKGDYAKAEDEDRKALDLLRKYIGPESSLTVGTAATLGLTLTREGKAAEGERFLRSALEIRTRVLPPGDIYISIVESSLGECVTAQKRYAEAEPLLLKGYTGMKGSLGEKDPRTIEALKRLVTLYRDWKKPDKAAQLLNAQNQ